MRFEPLPPMAQTPGLRTWCAKVDRYSFVICYEPLDDPEWHGYTATWKSRDADMRPALPGFGGQQPANRIEGGPFRTFRQAEMACEATLRQLRARS